jgi:hypothetical protein
MTDIDGLQTSVLKCLELCVAMHGSQNKMSGLAQVSDMFIILCKVQHFAHQSDQSSGLQHFEAHRLYSGT